MQDLSHLNPAQQEAVSHTEGPLLIVAGAGAGKTKVITERIRHLIRKGVSPKEILAITFTNKAAKEMRERVRSLIQNDPVLSVPLTSTEMPFASTFHSLGVHILREQHSVLKIPRNFTIFDKDDSRKAIKKAILACGYDPKQFDIGKMSGMISKQKGNGLTNLEYAEEVGDEYVPRTVSSVWNRYEEILEKEKALDFDDLLLKTFKLLLENISIAKYYQNVWKYVHIDEYQDTNHVQYRIARLLSSEHKNIAVVGDIDQNIYSWRGAKLKNIIDFEKDYPGAKVVMLEQNYRSTKTILNVANETIAKNKMRREKNLFTLNEDGEKVGLFESYDESDEAMFVANKAKALIKKGVRPTEIAVLFRANFQSRALEEAFLSQKIPYQVLGVRFFERKEIKDVLSYAKLALNRESSSELKRVINVPARGIGKVTFLKILENKVDSLPTNTKNKVNNFFKLLDQIEAEIKNHKTSEIIKFIIEKTGLEENLKNSGNDEDLERLENIGELITLAKKYDEFEDGLEKLLTDAALASDQDSLEENKEAVKLMTVHASKGLEFDYVFITGLEDGLFPHQRLNEADISQEDSEEERRLFYVALTRARKKVYLSYAQSRTIFGTRSINMPSEFVTEIDDRNIEVEEKTWESVRKPLLIIDF